MAKRRNFSAEFKAEVVLAVLSGAKSQAEVCREHRLSPMDVNGDINLLTPHDLHCSISNPLHERTIGPTRPGPVGVSDIEKRQQLFIWLININVRVRPLI